MKHPESAYCYAEDIIKERWPEAESYIMKCPYCAYEYAKNVIKSRWPEAEEHIKKDKFYWSQYCDWFKIEGD